MFRMLCVGLLVVGVGCFTGCTSETPKTKKDDHDHEGHDHDHDHAHSHEGPHKGHLIEFGHDHAYHGEIVEDEKEKKITFYMLDGKMKPFALETETLAAMVSVDKEKFETFTLKAVDLKDGKATEFVTEDAAMFESLEKNEEPTIRISVSIEGKNHIGTLKHGHHDDHDH